MSLAIPSMIARQPARLAFWVAIAIVLAYLVQDFALGGNAYKQGDWLINIDQVVVRRGILGSAFIAAADFLHLDLLLLVVLVQAGLLLLFAACLWRVISKLGEHAEHALYWLLIFSPTFVILFWANDPQGSLRKEILVYAAFGLILYALANRAGAADAAGSPRWPWAGAVALFAAGMIAHEANLLFLPAFAWLLYRSARAGLVPWRELALTLALLLAVAALSAGFFLLHVSLTDAGPVCAPLLARGLSAGFCDGAIRWVTRDLSYAMRVTAGNWSAASWGFWLIYGWASALVLWFSLHFVQRRRLLLMYGLTALPFLPLFHVALDWGRWMNFHISSWIFLVLADYLLGRLQQSRPCNDRHLFVLLFSFAAWAPSHMTYLVLPRALIVLAGVFLLLRLLDIGLLGWHRLAGRKSLASPNLPDIEKT